MTAPLNYEVVIEYSNYLLANCLDTAAADAAATTTATATITETESGMC